MSKSNKNPLLRKFGILVHDARVKKGLSQEELGFELDLHRTYIGMIERAERNISFSHALKLIQYLDINIKELYAKQKKS